MGNSARTPKIKMRISSLSQFSCNVVLKVEIQKDFEGIQPSGKYAPSDLLGSMRMLIFNHVERLDVLARDGYRTRTRQGDCC
jgi:hypothetical protein